MDGVGEGYPVADELVGRGPERDAIARVLDAARDGLSGVLVLTGEAGVGKTALLSHAVAVADLRVVAVAGVETEAGLGHAALHRLLRPHLDRLDALPPPQRRALAVAFGLEAGEPPDRFLVGLAALTLLSAVAADEPLLCVVDDAHWLDPESLAVLAFVARRLLADGIALLFVRRSGAPGGAALEGLPALDVGGLDEGSAMELLRARASGFVDDAVARRLVADSLGNALALVELARELTPGQLAGVEMLPAALPLGRELEQRFLQQVRRLPSASRRYLLVAAADPEGDEVLVAGAAAELGIPAEALDAVAASGLLLPDLRFRHPLVRSAVLAAATPDDLRRVHAALAAGLGTGGSAPDRRAWHRAEATPAPDDEVAAEVEEAALGAIRRGGYATAAALLERAGRLSPGREERGRRLLAAAEAHLAAGNAGRAGALVDEAGHQLDDDRSRAQVLRLDGAVRLADGRIVGTAAALVQAAHALAPTDVRGARQALLEATSAALHADHATRQAAMAEVARGARAIPRPDGEPPSSGDLLLDALAALFTDGHRVAAPALRAAVDAAVRDETGGRELLRWLGFACWAAGAVGDNDGVRRAAGRLVALSREVGALGDLTRGLYFLGIGDVVTGDLAGAAAHFAESRDLSAVRGPSTSPGEAIIAAWRGEESETHRRVAEIVEVATSRGQGGVVVYTDHALAVLELGSGHYDRALAAALRVDAEGSHFLATVALPDLVEAACRAGAGEVAVSARDRCRRRAEVNGTALARGLAARAAGLVAASGLDRGAAGAEDDEDEADEAAESCFLASVDHLGSAVAVGHLARSRLVYGEWLRRRQRRRDAREQLRAAHEGFVAIGAEAFARRAAAELEATGERVRRRTVDTAEALTPQEAKVAALAAERATNGEIAAQLFISPSTVDYHLRKVFRKLGVSSRRDLARALREGG